MNTRNEMFKDFCDVVSVLDLCKMLNIGRNIAYQIVKEGMIRAKKVGRKYIITKNDVIEFLEAN